MQPARSFFFYFLLISLATFLWAFVGRTFLIASVMAESAWVAGDWLINLSAGFVRRGLSGELVSLYAQAANISLLAAIVNIKQFFYIIIAAALLLLAYRKRLSLIELVLLLSPWALMFHLHDISGGGRKEILLFASLLCFLVIAEYRGLPNGRFLQRWSFWFLSAIGIFLVLLHEGLAFFFHFFAVYLLLRKTAHTMDDWLEICISYGVMASFFVVIAMFFRGTESQAQIICDSLIQQGLAEGVCGGAIAALGGFEFTPHAGHWRTYLPALLLSGAAVVIYGVGVADKTNFTKYLTLGLLSFSPVIPLFAVGADWGRWIHIWAFCLFLTYFAAKNQPAISWNSVPLLLMFFVALGFWLYLFGWFMPHWIGGNPDMTLPSRNFGEALRRLF